MDKYKIFKLISLVSTIISIIFGMFSAFICVYENETWSELDENQKRELFDKLYL